MVFVEQDCSVKLEIASKKDKKKPLLNEE